MGGTPCAACKFLRRKCTDDCVFAPHFPAGNPAKFTCIHKVFGASNVSKILNDIPPHQREDAVRSLVYEAELRVRDPIHGCVGLIAFMHQYLTRLQHDLLLAKQELARYMSAFPPPFLPPPQLGNNLSPNFIIPQGRPLVIREPNSSQQHQQLQDEHLKRMAAEFVNSGDHQNGMFNGFGIENNGFVTARGFRHMNDEGPSGFVKARGFSHLNDQGPSGFVTARGFSHMTDQGPSGFVTARGFSHMTDQGPSGLMSGPSLALGSFGDNYVMEQEIEQDHMNHDQGPSGSMSAPTPASGSFGDNDVMEQEIEEDHMNHDQASNTEEAPRSSSENSGQTVSDAEMGQENLHQEEVKVDEELETPVKRRKS